MRTTLLCLHGFTLNGAQMQGQLGPLLPLLAEHVDVLCPDAPHVCSAESVDRMYARWGTQRLPAPYLNWWNASDDGREYSGWETTRQFVIELLERHAPVGVLGFSQGGILAAAIAALVNAGELPAIRFAILVAAGAPRADVFQPLLVHKIALPSLHVWGQQDTIAASAAPALVEYFEPGTRQVQSWSGPHVVPTQGPAADAIVSFCQQHA